ncbi:MAG: thymidylate kinase [Oscillospiraceae bacterium]|jgi:dTMP kinase|nr:thymidylate kinase [Oscillospiraceae bacterium]
MGKLIVLEGIDGSGKSTQFARLCERLAREGADFTRVTFPRYSEPSSALVRMYLSGEFGSSPDSVNAYAASSFFAVDRFASFQQTWRAYYEDGGLVLTDRYTTSNAIHQGSKLPPDARRDFFNWLYDFEFRLMGLPAPALVLYMELPPETAARRRSGRDGERDIHERDGAYLEACAACGAAAADFYGWRKIDAARGEDDVHGELYQIIREEL